jgi:PhzF family phenazine biosynthesis protein
VTNVVPLRLIDVFAAGPYTGNPAGVVLEADALAPPQMQAIARELRVSETAFVSRANDLHRPPLVRWFSPACEVQFCGHATLAAVHALTESAGTAARYAGSDERVRFETAAGELELFCESVTPEGDATWWLRMPAPTLRPDGTNPKTTCELLGLTLDDLERGVPLMRTRDGDVILLITSVLRLNELRPRFSELADWSRRHRIRGYCVATTHTLTPSMHVQSRFFAPAVGIDEDPVTGSVHGPLAALLVRQKLVTLSGGDEASDRAAGDSRGAGDPPRMTNGGRALLHCVQSAPGGTAGLVRVLVEGEATDLRVAISGKCCTTLRGELRVPPTT